MKKITLVLSLLLLTSCSMAHINHTPRQSNSNETTITSTDKIKNVIMFIGDGMGPNHVDAGGIYKGSPLCFDVTDENWTYHAYSNTDSRTSYGFTLDTTKSLLRPEENSTLYDKTPSPYGDEVSTLGTPYTDSAAGGTALATGVKVTNARLGMDINNQPIENLVEIAKGLNMKTGVVTSDNIVGATPSSFLVHVGERHQSEEILNQVATSKADLILAKNTSDYKNNKAKYESLYKNNGFDVIYDKASLKKESNKIIGLFNGVMAKTDPRAPSLEELTAFSLDYLDNDEGFFLMVEGARIDKESHSHQTEVMFQQLLGFDRAVETAQRWAEGRDDTIIVVTADHETGGLYYNRSIATQKNIVDEVKWLTSNHSRTRVDIAIYGDISRYIEKNKNRFSTLEGVPYWDNTDVFRICCEHLNSKY